jgi:hypothetical protein
MHRLEMALDLDVPQAHTIDFGAQAGGDVTAQARGGLRAVLVVRRRLQPRLELIQFVQQLGSTGEDALAQRRLDVPLAAWQVLVQVFKVLAEIEDKRPPAVRSGSTRQPLPWHGQARRGVTWPAITAASAVKARSGPRDHRFDA